MNQFDSSCLALGSVAFLLGATQPKHFPQPDVPEIAFSGRSNVGKSSLINMLTRRKKLAKTSNTPGRTQQINFFALDTWRLVDLPGYGYAKAPVAERNRWGQLVDKYLRLRKNLVGVVQLVDSRHPDSPLDEEMFMFLSQTNLPWTVALTKTDKISKSQLQQLIQNMNERTDLAKALDIIPCSIKASLGRVQLQQSLVKMLYLAASQNPHSQQPPHAHLPVV